MAAVKGIAALEGNWWYGGTLSAKGQEAIDDWTAVRPSFLTHPCTTDYSKYLVTSTTVLA